MNKIKIIVSLVFILVVAGVVLWSKVAEKPAEILSADASGNFHPARIGGTLTASENFYDFGTISMKNGNVSKIFQVTNSTDQDIAVPSLTTSCMCTNAYFIGSDGSKVGPFSMPGMGFVPKLNKTIQ